MHDPGRDWSRAPPHKGAQHLISFPLLTDRATLRDIERSPRLSGIYRRDRCHFDRNLGIERPQQWRLRARLPPAPP